MEDRPETLRRRITVYRRCLQEGAVGTLATVYLDQIALAEFELSELDHTPVAEKSEPQR